MDRFTAIDLSRAVAPDVVQAPDYAAILDAAKADIVARVRLIDAQLADDLGATLAIEAELVTKVVESAAYRQTIHYQRVNDAGRAIMLAYAAGTDLEHLGYYYGVSRLVLVSADADDGVAVMESDDDLRRRIQLAPEAFSVAGPVGAYKFHGLTYSGDVKDVGVVKPAPGQVNLHILYRYGDRVPPESLLLGLARRFRDDALVPLTDSVSVAAPAMVDFDISATLRVGRGPDPATIRAEALAAMQKYLASREYVGAAINRSGLMAACHVPSVERVDLVSPAVDVDPTPAGFARPGAIALTIEVV